MPQPSRREPETLRDLRRGQIIATARAIVAKEGIAALTFGALEARLSFSRGVITYHFEDKDEIVRAVLDSAVLEIDEATRSQVEQGSSIEDKVRAAIRANVRGFVDNPEAGRILLSFWGRIGSDPRIAAENARLHATYRKRMRKLVDGQLPAGDADALATVTVGLVVGIATQWYFEPRAIDVDRAIEEGTELVLARLRQRG